MGWKDAILANVLVKIEVAEGQRVMYGACSLGMERGRNEACIACLFGLFSMIKCPSLQDNVAFFAKESDVFTSEIAP